MKKFLGVFILVAVICSLALFADDKSIPFNSISKSTLKDARVITIHVHYVTTVIWELKFENGFVIAYLSGPDRIFRVGTRYEIYEWKDGSIKIIEATEGLSIKEIK